MDNYKKLIFKLWFKNGTYIEKELEFDEDASEEIIRGFEKGIQKMNNVIKTCFKEDMRAELNINNMIVRCSELIAFDIIPIMNKESED